MSCMHGMACPDTLCVERQARGECLATAAEALADLGPVLDAWCDEVWGPDWRTSMAAGGCGMSDVYRDRLRAVWTTARAKLVTT